MSHENKVLPAAAVDDGAGMAPAGQRTCILVLGMHRSGTSALTRLLSLAGAELPKKLLGAGEGNEAGHWEPELLTIFHDRILSELGSAWHDWRGPNFSQLSEHRKAALRDELVALLEQDYGNADLFVVKDPRICRFVPFFASALEKANIRMVPVLIFRNPLDVVSSLQSRQSLWPEDYASADGALLWLRHVLDADEATRSMRRTVTTFDAVLSDWRGALRRISEDTGLVFPRSADEIAGEVESFLSPDLRHQRASRDDIALDPVMGMWIADAYEAIDRLSQDSDTAGALSKLDEVRTDFAKAFPMLKSIGDMRQEQKQQNLQLKRDLALQGEKNTYLAGTLKLARQDLKNQQEATSKIIAAYENSLSFKITRPLRAAKSLSQGVTGNSAALAGAIRRRGGVVPTIKKSMHVLRHHGFGGFRQRLRTLSRLEQRRTRPPVVRNAHPFVSIIVPNYNHAAFLEQRLETILAQSYQNFELIMLDDCSSDNSLEIMKRFEEAHPDKARLVPNETNSGSGYRQWAKGLTLAHGELVWIAESDDWSSPEFLESLLPAFEEESVMLAYVNSAFMDTEGKEAIWSTTEYLNDIDSDLWNEPFQLSGCELVKLGFATKNLVPNVSSAVFRHPGHENELLSGPWTNMKICGDWLFYLSLIRGGAVSYLPEMLNYYRIHQASTAKSTFVKDVYYREHEDVARYAMENFEVPKDFAVRQQSNLRKHWKAHREDFSEERLRECYDVERLEAARLEKKPSIMMAGFGFAAGGGETFPIFLANFLKAHDYPVTFLSCEMEPREDGVRGLLRPDIPVVTDIDNIAAVVEDFGIDVIHSHHGWVDSKIIEGLSKKGSRTKVVVSLHGMYEMMEPIDQDIVVPRLFDGADALVYTSTKNLEPFKRLGLPWDKKITGIPNALPEVPIHPMSRASLGIPEDAFLLCLVSRAIPDKGWQEAVEAVNLARNRSGLDIQLMLIGEGDEYDKLKESVGAGSHVSLLGFKRNLRDYFATADMGFLPSRFRGESFPLVLIDCLAAGKPFLASNVGEIRHMLDAGNRLAGEIFELNNWQLPIEEMAEIIAKAAQSGPYYREMCDAVPAAYEKFNPEVMVQKYIDVYHRVLRNEPPHLQDAAVSVTA